MVLFLKSIWPYRWLILAYSLVIGFAEATSIEADKATAEAVRQHEASRVQVEEYNRYIKGQKGEL